MPSTADPRIDAYIDALPEWQQSIWRGPQAIRRASRPLTPACGEDGPREPSPDGDDAG